jgi:hypothetical protein
MDEQTTVERPAANRKNVQRAGIGRKDPKSRDGAGIPIAHDGTPGHLKLKNRDPAKHYVLACRTGERTNSVPHYEAMGYEIEPFDPNNGVRLGARMKTSKRAQDDIEWNGHVLMSVDLERYNEIVEEGPDGVTGNQLVRRLEAKISGRETHREAFRAERNVRGIHEDLAGSREAQEND